MFRYLRVNVLVFATTNASEVRAVTDARNSASVRVLKMAGFAFVTEQQAVFKGQACTEHVYVNRRVSDRGDR